MVSFIMLDTRIPSSHDSKSGVKIMYPVNLISEIKFIKILTTFSSLNFYKLQIICNNYPEASDYNKMQYNSL